MRFVTAVAVFGLMLTVPLWAQHGGGGHSGGVGHAGGFGGAHMGGGHAGFSGSSGVHSFSGMRSSPGVARSFSTPRAFSRPGFSRPSSPGSRFARPSTRLRAFNGRGPFLHDGFRDRDRFRERDRFRDRGFLNSCIGWGCSAWAPWWGYDPWLWNDDSSYDQSYEQNLADAAEMNRENLEEQQMLRQEEADGDQDAYARPVPPRAPVTEAQGSPIQPTTVLIFRDQHKQEVENYAIVGRTLWNFAPQHTQKISLSDLDVAATIKANDDRGVTFRVPGANQSPAPPANMQGQPPTPTTPISSSV